MGVHICVERREGGDVSEWDYVRQSHDRELDDFLYECTVAEDFSLEVRRIRPDLDQLTSWIKALPSEDQDRYWLLHKLLSEHDYWIYLSR